MRVLWITNVLLSEATALLTGDGAIRMSGGWLSAMADAISKNESIELFVASVGDNVKYVRRIEGERIHYFLLPRRVGQNRYDAKLENDWITIKESINPDIVHVHGTEFPYGLSYIRSCGTDRVIVSIQGMTSEIVKYCKGGLSNWDILSNITFRDLVRRDSIFTEVRRMKQSARYEVELLGRVRHVIGRTEWDKIHSLSINKDLNYYHNDELLRDSFYEGQWSYDTCIPHTIFVSQAHCPLKGFHYLLRAVALIKADYPNTRIRVAGWNIFKGDSFLDSFKRTGYAKYLNKLIRQYDLADNVSMIGFLDADGIKRELLSSNVYVCPSSIENSPNSLCEAQILGVPCIASYVGGIPGFMEMASDRMYRYDDWRHLSYLIENVFNTRVFEEGSIRQSALLRHDRSNNASRLIEIYHSVF